MPRIAGLLSSGKRWWNLSSFETVSKISRPSQSGGIGVRHPQMWLREHRLFTSRCKRLLILAYFYLF